MTLTIKLVRHGESEANLRHDLVREIGDHAVPLTTYGREQARNAGRAIGAEFLRGALIYGSPYLRTRETLDELLDGAGLEPGERATLRRYEDPRLREVEHGYADVGEQRDLRRTHGRFYYRFHGGESPADCYDRTSGFIETMMRQVERKNAKRVALVTHGLTIRCFVMRFLHLSVEQFDDIANPDNANVITIKRGEQPDSRFSTGRWSVAGLRSRTSS